MNKPILENSLFRNQLIVYFLLIVLLAITYAGLIHQDTILNYDDKLLLGPIQSTHSLSDYVQFVRKGVIADIQPVRDFSYWIDFKLKGLLPFYSFHLSNVAYWLLACIVFYKILLLENCDSLFALFFLLFYSISPVSSSSIAWIAGRKHILSALFILLATFFTLKSKSALKIAGTYVLSILSQPINTLWPLWNYFHSRISLKIKRNNLFGILLTFCIASLAANYFYYQTIYTSNLSTVSKFIEGKEDGPGLMLLALGRYFYQCLNPFSALPTTHYQGSWENMAGLLLLLTFALYCFKSNPDLRKRILGPLLFFVLPLSVVVIKRTNIFCSDTYVLTSSAGLYWAFALIASEKLNYKWVKISIFVILIPLFIFNLKYVNLFKDEDSLWTYSQEKEANSQSTVIVASMLIQKKKFYESYLLIKKLQEEWPEQPFIPQLIAENIFHNPGIPIDKRIVTLETAHPKTTSTYLYLSVLYARANQVDKLRDVLPKIFTDRKNFNMEFHGSEEKIAAIFFYTCEYFKFNSCNQTLLDFKNTNSNILWYEGTFQEYLKIFKSSSNYGVQ